MATKKKAVATKVVKDPTLYVVVDMETYEHQISKATCAVRQCNGDGLSTAIKSVANYNGNDYVVVLRVEKIVRVPPAHPKTVPALSSIPVEEVTS